MSTLRRSAEDYLAMRRSLGYKLQRQGPLLLDFAGYLERTGAATVTIEAAVAWATLPAGAAPVWWKHRLSVVRGFAAHLKTLDPRCQVPPAGLLPAGDERATPYLYSPDEIASLVHAAGTLARPLLAATYQALISLLAVSGLRAGEAIRLTRDDAGLDGALLAVINSKFGKSRLVPLHPATAGMLRRYAARRDQLCPAPATSRFFISTTGTPLLISSVDAIFARLLGLAGIRTPPGRPRPRVHDLRHSMAVATLLEWYRSGADVQARMPLLSTWLGHADPASTFWVPARVPRAAGPGRRAAGRQPGAGVMSALAPVLEAFFTERLMTQRRASPNTIASYRDTFRLLLGYAREHTGKPPGRLDFADLDAPLISGFLTHLETGRDNSITTRNARLAAIHSLFGYAALRAPEHAALITRVLAIPAKRHDHATVSFLTRPEIEALLAAPDTTTWHGRRDHALLLVATQTGLRVSELTGLTIADTHLNTGPHVYCQGKGRKERCTPLTTQTVAALTSWLAERGGHGPDPLFPTRSGGPLSRDAVERLLAKYVTIAASACPSMQAKAVSPHTLRHSAAMSLLHAGVDITVIALWLGHSSPASTRVYLHADMQIKERALARTTPPDTKPAATVRPTACSPSSTNSDPTAAMPRMPDAMAKQQHHPSRNAA